MCGCVMYESWLTLRGLCGAKPLFVANENLVTQLTTGGGISY